jgi:hypothetical protein
MEPAALTWPNGRPMNNLLVILGRETRVLKVAEYWNDGMMGRCMTVSTPIFHYSIIPKHQGLPLRQKPESETG